MTVWTEERIAKARRLWEEGYSASIIADILGETTKNAVIGQAHRRKWGQRRPAYAHPRTPAGWLRPDLEASLPLPIPEPPAPPPTPLRTPPKPKPPPPPPPPPQNIEDRVVPVGRHIRLLDLKGRECKWPLNSPPRGGEYLFCGEPQFNGFAYCEHHARIGFSGKGTARAAERAGWQPRQAGF